LGSLGRRRRSGLLGFLEGSLPLRALLRLGLRGDLLTFPLFLPLRFEAPLLILPAFFFLQRRPLAFHLRLGLSLALCFPLFLLFPLRSKLEGLWPAARGNRALEALQGWLGLQRGGAGLALELMLLGTQGVLQRGSKNAIRRVVLGVLRARRVDANDSRGLLGLRRRLLCRLDRPLDAAVGLAGDSRARSGGRGHASRSINHVHVHIACRWPGRYRHGPPFGVGLSLCLPRTGSSRLGRFSRWGRRRRLLSPLPFLLRHELLLEDHLLLLLAEDAGLLALLLPGFL